MAARTAGRPSRPRAIASGRRDGWRDVLAGMAGAGIMTASLLTPFLRRRRARWGVPGAAAERALPGDDLVPRPRWTWTHGIEVAAPAEAVWPWIAQIGADRGGFYSYQWLENLIGCHVRNADRIHPGWAAHQNGELRLHPKAPPLRIALLVPGRSLVASMPPAPAARAAGDGTRWMAATWLFHVEPIGPRRCRVISRYRCATSDDLISRLQFGPALVEPVSFAMDRRMLIGVRQRAERKIR